VILLIQSYTVSNII